MQNLNKSNYFDKLKEKYPKAVELFCSWVDTYKTSVHWNTLFNADGRFIHKDEDKPVAPKFHDLPYELQYGIILRFFAQFGRLILLPPPEAGEWFETLFASMENGTLGFSGLDITSPGANAIFMERMKQIKINGYDADYDKSNENGELATVACILITGDATKYPKWWNIEWLEKALEKPYKTRLAMAGALFAAEYDRINEDEKLNHESTGNS